MRRLSVLLALLGLSLVALSRRSQLQAWAYESGPAKQSGEPAPELPAGTQTLDGHALRLAELRGQVVLLHFWTFGCGNCEHMLPYYSAWDERYRARGLRVIGVHTPELPHERNLESLRAFVKKKGLGWPVVPDQGEVIWDRFGVHAWPTIFVIDREAKIAATFVGDDRAGEIEDELKRLLP
jgi:thiol-disulfide isomerase/thioredoxin